MAYGSSSSYILHRNEEDHENDEQDVPLKKQRIPYPDAAEVIALSPTTLMAKNRFICEVCRKGFPREQNLQLHKRGHNLPWKLATKPKTDDQVKLRKTYICPEPSCIHHNRSHSLGDLTGIKKHYSRKHGEKKYKCQNCPKKYAVQSDLKAHTKTCGNKEYQCHSCDTLFTRRDSFISHTAFCEALALFKCPTTVGSKSDMKMPELDTRVPSIHTSPTIAIGPSMGVNLQHKKDATHNFLASLSLSSNNPAAMQPQLSATALLHKASLLGSTSSSGPMDGTKTNFGIEDIGSNVHESSYVSNSMWNLNADATYEQGDGGFQQSSGATMLTRDFLGVGLGMNISSDGPESTYAGRRFL